MIDHISIAVRDLVASARFYQAVLEPLGFTRLIARPTTVGFGIKYPEFWLNARPAMSPIADDTGVHICLRARSPEAVDEFHARALAQGGRDDGAPGPREAAMVTYYAAFIRDLDGNKIEVMTVPQTAGA
ncbi:VOC family protein [Bradyrhizobium sp. 2TAF24]|uniref:VOC family protein n=1 Tax=Bradyrhizobium sp. 2TAF24 TaxID=3233011 RepID=UPI003F935C47